MANGHELQRWDQEEQLHTNQAHHRRPFDPDAPSFIPPQTIIPANRGFWSYVGRSWFLIVVVVVFFLIVLPWIIALLILLWHQANQISISAPSFLDGVHPFVTDNLATWSVAAIAGLIIGALIRLLRKI